MVHRINIFLLSILLVVSQVMMMNQALAAGLGGWSVGNPISQGASSIVSGTKSVVINGANVLKSGTAKITPTVAQVSKVLARGLAGYALSVAVEQLLGSVGWVLDAANNQIVYNDPNKPDPGLPDNFDYGTTFTGSTIWYSTKKLAIDSATRWINEAFAGQIVTSKTSCSNPTGNMVQCYVYWNYAKDEKKLLINESLLTRAKTIPVEEPDKKTLPLDAVSAQVISNAESGDTSAQEATKAAATDALANDSATQDSVRNQLESNAKTQTNEQAQAETKPKDPTAPEAGSDIAIKFPVFCGWAPTVCEAAQTVISFPQTLTNWWDTGKTKAESWAKSISEAWTSTKEWMNKEETKEQTTQVEIDQTVPVIPDNQYFNWGAYCPFTPGSQTISLEDTNAPIDYDLTSWCDMATDIRPFVLAAGALMSFLIAAGVVMGRDD